MGIFKIVSFRNELEAVMRFNPIVYDAVKAMQLVLARTARGSGRIGGDR